MRPAVQHECVSCIPECPIILSRSQPTNHVEILAVQLLADLAPCAHLVRPESLPRRLASRGDDKADAPATFYNNYNTSAYPQSLCICSYSLCYSCAHCCLLSVRRAAENDRLMQLVHTNCCRQASVEAITLREQKSSAVTRRPPKAQGLGNVFLYTTGVRKRLALVKGEPDYAFIRSWPMKTSQLLLPPPLPSLPRHIIAVPVLLQQTTYLQSMTIDYCVFAI
jgi:hypothetical protein